MPFDRIAVITGAGSGIGRAVAIALVGDGWTIVAAGRRAEPLDETIAACVTAGGGGAAHVVDVSSEKSVAVFFADVEERFGRVDLLFNNAGTSAPPVPIDELDPAEWRRVVDVNLSGAFYCAQQAVALMKRQNPGGGRIINNGSISAHAPRPDSVPYTATKHAITGLTKSIALDGRAHRIACGQIDIGNASTPMTERMSGGVRQADGAIRPEPTMQISDVAAAVVYMAGLPLDANVLTMTVMATEMPFVGRG